MDANEIKNVVCQVLTEIQVDNGRPAPNLSGGTCPMGVLDGFDSYSCLEASMRLSDYLGCEIEKDLDLFSRQGRPRTIDEIAQDLCQIIGSREED